VPLPCFLPLSASSLLNDAIGRRYRSTARLRMKELKIQKERLRAAGVAALREVYDGDLHLYHLALRPKSLPEFRPSQGTTSVPGIVHGVTAPAQTQSHRGDVILGVQIERGCRFCYGATKSPVKEPTPPMRAKNITQRFQAFVQNPQESFWGDFQGQMRRRLKEVLEKDAEQQMAE
jgi:hypothetical protein